MYIAHVHSGTVYKNDSTWIPCTYSHWNSVQEFNIIKGLFNQLKKNKSLEPQCSIRIEKKKKCQISLFS